MQQYNVTGMSCAACSARVEKAVSKVDGVTSCSVSLLTNSMGVEGSASPQDVIKAVEDAGYGASVKGGVKKTEKKADALKDTETPKTVKRLIASLVFLAMLMSLSMGHMVGIPVPPFLAHNPVSLGIAQLLLAAIVMVINQKFFISGFKGLLHLAPNMDTLVALGSGTAFVYSTVSLFLMSAAQAEGDMEAAREYLHEFYFESAAMILTLITVGKLLEAKSKGKTTDALKSLMNLSPKTAVVLRGGTETEVSIDEVMTGDKFIVRAGGSIPADGVVLEGGGAVDESALTGESIPVDKAAGDAVSAATINRSGYLLCRATRVGEDTTLSQIIKLVSDTAATKAPIAKIADKVSGIFVPAVIGAALVTAVIWLIVGESAGFAFARAISVLVISCPCALGLATPVAIMVGSGVGAKNGILFKSAASLEETGKLKTVVLDKTGTITLGKPSVIEYKCPSGTDDDLWKTAYALENKSEHPLADAILTEARHRNCALREVTDFETHPGNGLTAVCEGEQLAGGNLSFISKYCAVPDAYRRVAEEYAQLGQTPLFFSRGGEFAGVIGVADKIRPGNEQAIAELKEMGLRVVMLTGDNPKTAAAIGEQAGVDEVVAGVLPDGKAAEIQKRAKEGKIAMVGDGINDAPALTAADVGIAVGAGTDVAIDAADVVLMDNSLSGVAASIRLGRATLRNIRQNLFWAFIYNIIGIPLAAGAYIAAFGWKLNPMFGAAAMSLSSFCVVTNALRLNFVKLHPKKSKQPEPSGNHIITEEKEQTEMTVIMKINGMMCEHCEARVKKALEAIPQVEKAEPDYNANQAVVTLREEVPFDVLKAEVEAQDYEVVE